MSIRHLAYLSLFLLLGLVSLPTAQSANPQRLVATAIQDEARKIPEDNTAYFSRADRKVRFQLVKLSGAEGQTLAGASVKVIGPSGEEAKLTADAEGIATLENAKPGLHALVVAGKDGHTAVPIALREESLAQAADAAAMVSAPTVKLPLMDIDPKEVLRLTGSYLSPEMSGGYDEIDNDFVTTGEVSQGLQYRVRLGDDGTLSGQVYSLVRNGVSTYGVAGTNILIYQSNQLVSRTTADQAGKFYVPNMVPGVYGLVGAGPAGYAAFGFEAYQAATVAKLPNDKTLVSVRPSATELTAANNLAPGSVLPVLLIPPAMVPAVIEQIRAAGFPVGTGTDGVVADAGLSSPVPGIGQAPLGAGPGGAVGGGFGGGFGGGTGGVGLGGGAGGLLGLAAIGGIAAAAINADNNNNNGFLGPLPGPSTNGLLQP